MGERKKIYIRDIEEFDAVEVIDVLVAPGDQVQSNQPLVTIESEKVMVDFPSPYDGVVKNIAVKAGDQICEGAVLLTLETDDSTAANQTAPALDTPRADQAKAVQETGPEDMFATPATRIPQGEHAYASPAIYAYARELGINLAKVKGSGHHLRILKEDVQSHVRNRLQKNEGGGPAAADHTAPLDFSAFGESEAVALTKIQKITAGNMVQSWQNIPHVTHFDQADVTRLEQHRKKLVEALTGKDIKLTPLAFVVKALVLALKQFPQFNASFDPHTAQLIIKKYFHIGIAVDTPHGLLVPVLRDVDRKTIGQVALELVEISHLARQRKLKPEHMSGASMTISSLGSLGGQAFTPIINPPELAILGLSKMLIQNQVTGEGIVRQKLLPLSLSYDHRIINGADAARFCTCLKSILEDVWKLIC